MTMKKTTFPCTIMRGGTSKGIFLMEKDLPEDPGLRDRIILAVFGSPDIRQIDGLGGADSLTSKLAIIGPAKKSDYDIDYNFGAVGIDKAFVDYSANCGNISSAVGPYAVDKGLVKAVEPFTIVRIYNANTKKMIYSKVPVKKGEVVWEGNYAIAGCPGTAAKIELSFMDPGGATTGRLLPTGNVVDELKLDTGESYRVTIVDAGNPTAFVRAEELKLRGNELPAEFDQDMATRAKLEAIRKKVGEMMGIPVSQSIPKISFIAPAQDFKTVTGKMVWKDSVSMLARVMAMGKDAQDVCNYGGDSCGDRGGHPEFRGEPGRGRRQAGPRGQRDRDWPSVGDDGREGGDADEKRASLYRQLYRGKDGAKDHGRKGIRSDERL